MRHYARSIAYARLRDRAGFDRELAALARLRMSDAMKGMIDQGVPAADLAMLAELVARGRFASAERRYDDALGFYRQALERWEAHTSELQSLMRHQYADFCLTTKT